MSQIPYNPDDPLSINVSFRCGILGYYTPFMSCPLCRHYPCKLLTFEDLAILAASPLMDRMVKGLTHRRIKKMYIAKKTDGSLEMIESLDEKNPDPEMLRDVEEVYVINKVLVPVMTLKPKPKEEQEAVVAAAVGIGAGGKASEEAARPKRKRAKK